MKAIHIVLALVLTGPVIPAGAQETIHSQDTLMKKVLENNRSLRTARDSYFAAILEAGTGNTPPDPEVELGYLFGNPYQSGNRIDFSVIQKLDFPTTYIHQSRIRKIKTSQAELEYLTSRQEILLQAKQLWIERIHLNQQERLMEKRVEQARQINVHFQQKLAAGEVDQMAFGHSNLQLAVLESEYEQVLSNLRLNQLAIHEICGGGEIMIREYEFPDPVKLCRDSVIQAYRQSPELQWYQHSLELKEEQKNLAVSKNLPKLSAGYYSESLLDQEFKGFQLGLSVPLWENNRRVKQAKSEVAFAETDTERYAFFQDREVMQKLDRLESLGIRVKQMEAALSMVNEPQLLSHALNSGEISLSEYYYASDFYFRNQQLLLQCKRDLLLIEADLMKIYL